MMEIGVSCSSYVTLSDAGRPHCAVTRDPGGSVVSASLRARWPPRWWPAGLAWTLWALVMLGIAAGLWFDHLLRQAGRADLVEPNAIGVALAAGRGERAHRRRGRGRGAVAGGALPACPRDRTPAAGVGGVGAALTGRAVAGGPALWARGV